MFPQQQVLALARGSHVGYSTESGTPPPHPHSHQADLSWAC